MSESLEQHFVEAFALAATQAGAVARRLQKKVPAETKAGGTPEAEAVTAVDLAAQDVILHLLHRQLPGVAMDAEEETETLALFADGDPAHGLVVVDPVDGTLNYIRGSSDYAVMGALIRGGRYAAAVVHFPASGSTYWAVRDQGCYEGRPDGSRCLCKGGGAEELVFYTPDTPESWKVRLARAGARLELSRCSAVDSSAPAIGRARAALAPSRAGRRRSIGLFLTLEAGGAVRMGGRPWRGEDPVTLDPSLGPTVVADTEETADFLVQLLPGSGDV